jgi:hypothetical protein
LDDLVRLLAPVIFVEPLVDEAPLKILIFAFRNAMEQIEHMLSDSNLVVILFRSQLILI